MNLRNRVGTVVATATLGVATLLVSAACGTTAAASMSPEASALTALGFTDSDVTLGDAPSAVPSGGTDQTTKPKRARLRRLAIRSMLRKNLEHGSVTVHTKNGDKTIDIQRGEVTAITDTTITVKSTDGFVLTWTFGTPLKVIEHRSTVQPTDVTVGETVGVAGIKTGDTETARLLVIPNQK